MDKFEYTTSFSSSVKPLISEERDKYLALASLEEIGSFIPDVDTDKNIDLLPIAFNACVVNRANKNGDVIDTETAASIYKDFINKPINVEHNRNRVVGVILTAGFSEFGTDKPLTEDEVKGSAKPFNITLGGVVWRVAHEDLAYLIEESSDPTSENYLKVSASWELGFSNYNIVKVVGEGKNIENGEIIADEKKIEKIKNNLKSLGGDGKIDDDHIYRLVTGDVVPLGIGLTESPAADVKGVATRQEDEDENLLINKNKSSQDSEKNVSNEESQLQKSEKNIDMKITSLKDITDESLKTMEASMVSDFIETELKKKCDEYESDKDKLEASLEESRKDLGTLTTENEALKTNFESLKTEVEEMKTERATQMAEAKFNERMASFDEEYSFDDDIRKVIAEQLKAMPADDEDESYTSWVESSKVLLKRHSKEFIAEQEKISAAAETKEETKEEAKTETTEKVAEEKEETKASAEVEEVVEEVIENAEEVKEEIPNTTEASEPSVMEKYQQAFDLEQFEIKY
jgi:chorismate mutase